MESNIKLLNKIKNESEDIYLLSSMMLYKLDIYKDLEEDESEESLVKEIHRCLNDMFEAKDLLIKDFASLKRKTKGS